MTVSFSVKTVSCSTAVTDVVEASEEAGLNAASSLSAQTTVASVAWSHDPL